MTRPPKPIKPDGIRYWVDDRPPLSLSLLLAVQQIAFLGSTTSGWRVRRLSRVLITRPTS